MNMLSLLVDEDRFSKCPQKLLNRCALFRSKSFFYITQILNLVSALKQKKTPWELVRMPPTVVESIREGRTHKFIQKFRDRTPFFKDC